MKRLLICLAFLAATPAAAFDRISDQSTFLAAINGKVLSNRLYGVSLNVMGSGQITGDALGWNVTGSWAWKDGYFCRDMAWGGDPIPYNCQLVEIRNGNEVRFTSDQGTGDSASFKLR